MRLLTAGESHGEAIAVIIEGFPKGVNVSNVFINHELKRRQAGFGRGPRMRLEEDSVSIVSGMRNSVTLGSPLCLFVRNRDHAIFSQAKDNLSFLSVPRPGHADLAGCLKYGEQDVRNILERSSARETAARVCAGAVCKQLLSLFGIRIASFVVSIGTVVSTRKPKTIQELIAKSKKSPVCCVDPVREQAMMREIKKAAQAGDSLGGVVEVWGCGVPPGLGSCMHFDVRLDARIGSYLMSIPSVKGIEIGAGFSGTGLTGSSYHDAIYTSKQGLRRKSNNAGGIEGGISNGEPLIVRLAAKPIPTLKKPLSSVDLKTKKPAKASVVRSDVCVVEALGVVAESMLAIAVAESFMEKFGSDSLRAIQKNYRSYIRNLP